MVDKIVVDAFYSSARSLRCSALDPHRAIPPWLLAATYEFEWEIDKMKGFGINFSNSWGIFPEVGSWQHEQCRQVPHEVMYGFCV